jgi:alpha-L-fucosidase 2
MKQKMLLFVSLMLLLLSCGRETREDLRLWYTAPATCWMTEALPIGNGYKGAMIFGGVERERFQISEGSLWEGGPGSHPDYNFGNRPGAWQYLEPVRELINAGRFREAHILASRELSGAMNRIPDGPMFGDFGAQQTAGDIFIDIAGGGEVTNYYRDLNISNAVASVSYTQGGVEHRRTFFASYPRRVFVFRLENNARTGTDYRISYLSPHVKVNESFADNTFLHEGHVTFNKLGFQTAIHILNTDGEVSFDDDEGEIVVENARILDVVVTIATAYANHFPHFRATGWEEIVPTILSNVKGHTFNDLLAEHIADYQELFNRVSINLSPGAPASTLPTNERLIAYNEGVRDNALEALFFQYARYLLISSSRPGTMPATLQGRWNDSTDPPWANDYHLNINMQMIYWPALVTNLVETNEPLVAWTESLVEPGRVSAQDFFNARGWIANTMNNAFGFTAPGWGFPWGFFPTGAAWLCQHLWKHFEFTQDTHFLRERAFPVMKDAALFWIDHLVENEAGELVSSPSYSPEHGGISGGASMDHQIVWDLFNNIVQAAEVLGIDDEFTQQVAYKRDRISKPRIGRWGQLQEWVEDVDDINSRHRHISHLFAVFPGVQISPGRTPELAEAARISLNARGDDGTGWSLARKVNLWARLQDGNRAHSLLNTMLRLTHHTSTQGDIGGGIYPNMLSTHPPFQLDGNMGGNSGIVEMLLQSHNGYIHLLPALPDVWSGGNFSGLLARGGVEVDAEWEDMRLKTVTLTAKVPNSFTLKVPSYAAGFAHNGRRLPVENGFVTVQLNQGEQIRLRVVEE